MKLALFFLLFFLLNDKYISNRNFAPLLEMVTKERVLDIFGNANKVTEYYSTLKLRPDFNSTGRTKKKQPVDAGVMIGQGIEPQREAKETPKETDSKTVIFINLREIHYPGRGKRKGRMQPRSHLDSEVTTKSTVRAGFSEKTANSQAARMLANVNIHLVSSLIIIL